MGNRSWVAFDILKAEVWLKILELILFTGKQVLREFRSPSEDWGDLGLFLGLKGCESQMEVDKEREVGTERGSIVWKVLDLYVDLLQLCFERIWIYLSLEFQPELGGEMHKALNGQIAVG